jgi:hypothetical protein
MIVAIAAALAASGLPACGGRRADDGASAIDARQCQPPEETARALLVGWDPALRAALDTGTRGGVAVVRFDGCALELLEDCILEGEYVEKDAARSRSASIIRGGNELVSRLPLGAAALAPELRGGAALSLDYVTAAAENARLRAQSRGMLRGRCDRATHFVRSMVRGAYALSVLPQAGAGAEPRVVGRGGDLARCADDATPAGAEACRAVVQVTLTPIFELTSDRDDLYEDLGKEVTAVSDMEEALRALQRLAPPPPAAPPGAAPPPAGGSDAGDSSVSRGILALPGGGSDAWDAVVAPLLLASFDKDGSSRIDTTDEVAAIPCGVLVALDTAIKNGRGPAASLRTTYGFPKGYLWIGSALGFDEKIRFEADARLEECRL